MSDSQYTLSMVVQVLQALAQTIWESGEAMTAGSVWIMVMPGRFKTKYIPAEAPCWKGEINISLHWWTVTIGWQRKALALAVLRGNP